MKSLKEIQAGCNFYSTIQGIKGKDKFIAKHFHCGQEGCLCYSCQALETQTKGFLEMIDDALSIVLYSKTRNEGECRAIEEVIEKLKKEMESSGSLNDN